MRRRDLLTGLVSLAPTLALPVRPGAALAANPAIALGEPKAFDAAILREQARALATVPYQSPEGALPEVLAELDDDQHRDIRFRPEAALWSGLDLGAEVQFFHLGNRYRAPVHIYEVEGGMAREVLYAPELFDFGSNPLDGELSTHLGFAGFRLHYPLNRPEDLDEVAAFLGASNFRAIGRGQQYGLSARGIAVDPGLTSDEEFPAFRAFWLERPAARAERLTVHALLDGPSLAGAYRFVIAPGGATVMDVSATLFPRRAVQLIGLAPLTSMFLFGPGDRAGIDDFRPSVHDSDGLQIWTGQGEWIWRPLGNPATPRLSAFADDDPRGFGLLQRARDFTAYQDLEARYELRPSLWVEPQGAWGPGHVRLLELPTGEIHDNIAAFWVSKRPFEPGTERQIGYRLHWGAIPPVTPDRGRTLATRSGAGGISGEESDGAWRKFVIDFAGGRLNTLPAGAPVEAEVWHSAGEITSPVAQKNDVTAGWRAFFDLLPGNEGPTELRCVLRIQDTVLTETWTYQWTP